MNLGQIPYQKAVFFNRCKPSPGEKNYDSKPD
jgi:hypothetical protein